jgi:hypothetical protein
MLCDMPNKPSPIDSAWRTRVPPEPAFKASPIDSAWRTRIPPAARFAPTIAKAAEIEAEYVARPFRFEDLPLVETSDGPRRFEPSAWGPVYPNTASQAVEKWRRVASGRDLSEAETRDYGAAVHAWIRGLNAGPKRDLVSLKSTEFNAAKHRAKLRAEFAAAAAADKRNWALGKTKNNRGETIAEAYERAMAEKRERLEQPEIYAAKLKAAADRARLEAARKLAPIGPKARARKRKLVKEAA